MLLVLFIRLLDNCSLNVIWIYYYCGYEMLCEGKEKIF